MASRYLVRSHAGRSPVSTSLSLLAAGLLAVGACAHSGAMAGSSTTAPNPDPRVGLKAGLNDAGWAAWNMRLLSNSQSPDTMFSQATHSDLAFLGQYAIQGTYNGFLFWDITNPSAPILAEAYQCPASQSDVSVYKNLLFVSGEGLGGRLDCGAQGDKDTVSSERLRGLRIFDISDLHHPRNVGNVQTCRGSHTHTLLVDPKDPDNVYVYISGSAPVRSPNELAGCSSGQPGEDSTTALFRIEVIKVPLAHPDQAAIVSSPRIFNDLAAPPKHGLAPADIAYLAAAKARGAFIADIMGQQMVLPSRFADRMLDSVAKTHGRTAPTATDSTELRDSLPSLIAKMIGRRNSKPTGPTQCHDITVDPSLGLAGGACEGYGLLLDIRDPAHPVRLDAVSDSNFSYWHSATFSNDGTKILFTDEWGGGGAPKCRATDPKEWGADAIFTLADNKMHFQSYYKLPAPQTEQENCVAHNGSLIPIPGRDVMVQSWYQGGVSVFDWTDAKHPKEIAFFDRGPVDSTHMVGAGSWSAYWYNGVIVSSEIARGLDVFALQPSGLISQNELDAAKSVHFSEFNTQGQPKFWWPASFALSGAYVDQLARSHGLSTARITAVRAALAAAWKTSGSTRSQMLTTLAGSIDGDVAGSSESGKVTTLAASVSELAAAK
ncbi:MAG: LVIVD repeat-containing protein [Gemmatimonadales bacterium]